MLALLIEDVTLIKNEKITIQIRFKGGATTTINIPLPLNAWQGLKTPDTVVTLIADLSASHTDGQIAKLLNERNCVTGAGDKFSRASVNWIRFSRGIKGRKEHLQEKGLMTSDEFARFNNVSYPTVVAWRRKGLISGIKCNDKGDWLYHPFKKSKLNKKSNDSINYRQAAKPKEYTNACKI